MTYLPLKKTNNIALTSGYTVNDALNAASWTANYCTYGNSDLKNGETVWNPFSQSWSDTTYMKVWGDGAYQLPR
jgi:hypothetical protein